MQKLLADEAAPRKPRLLSKIFRVNLPPNSLQHAVAQQNLSGDKMPSLVPMPVAGLAFRVRQLVDFYPVPGKSITLLPGIVVSK